MSSGPREHLAATWPLGCLGAVLLGFAMALVIFVGTTMGDCLPGDNCHDDDGARIAAGLLAAAPIALLFGAGAWLLAAAVRALIAPRVEGWRLDGLLLLLTLALAAGVVRLWTGL